MEHGIDFGAFLLAFGSALVGAKIFGALAERVGIIERGRLLQLESPDELTARYGGGSLEEAFLAATGRTLGTADEDVDADADSDEDDDREVFG